MPASTTMALLMVTCASEVIFFCKLAVESYGSITPGAREREGERERESRGAVGIATHSAQARWSSQGKFSYVSCINVLASYVASLGQQG